MQRSSRTPEELGGRLQAWLAARLPAGASPRIENVHGTSATGMSSDTVLFDATWTDDGARRTEALVARLAPDPADVPVFPSYDLERQAQVLRLVAEHTSVPVPRVWWSEPDAAPLGTPFFVMQRVDGQVPPDVMPYNFGDSWLHDAPAEDQRRLQDATVRVLADLHAAPVEPFGFLEYGERGGTPLRQHVANRRAWYEYCVAGTDRSPLIDRAFAWLEDRWPEHEGPAVVSWGDSRIGNVMYRDFEPVAVFDWEMVGLGPRELDVTWLIYAHRAFEDMAAFFELPGMPHFLRPDEVVGTYEALTGHTPRDLEFYTAYCAIQWAIVFVRTGQRAIRFGEQEAPAEVDDLIRNREPLERMLAGEYWTAVR